jgi:hypothetical protein
MKFEGSREDFEYFVGLCAENLALRAALQARGVDTSNPVTVLQSQILPSVPTQYALPPAPVSQPSVLLDPAAIKAVAAIPEPPAAVPPTVISSPVPVRKVNVRAIAIIVSIVGAIAIGGLLSVSDRRWFVETLIRGVQWEDRREPVSDPIPESGVEAEVQPSPSPADLPPPPSQETLQQYLESPVGPVIYERAKI